MKTIENFENEALAIINNKELTDYIRNMALSRLMTDMERLFNIPLLANKEWEQNNVEVINLYRMIADSRNFN